MRKRLIELFKAMNATPEITCPRFNKESCKGCQFEKGYACDVAAREADFLLKNGVIALPDLKHKQVLYVIYNKTIKPLEVSSYMIRPEFNNLLQIHLHKNGFNGCCTLDDFGKTVFLRREEAEAALKGGASDVD